MSSFVLFHEEVFLGREYLKLGYLEGGIGM